jgi:8-hydroxy-5-deazaflavin:NADPH oxidoreductase
MNVGVLGTGVVGRTIGGALARAGYRVMMGSRTAGNAHAEAWAAGAGANASGGTFTEAAAFGEILFNCTAGTASLAALAQAGAENLAGKLLVDVANPLDFSRGMPPTLTVCNDDSLGEQIQRAYPDTMVVKALNTLNCDVMVNPRLVEGPHQLFICGDDHGAKEVVVRLLEHAFGWDPRDVMDLGDISAARGTEMVLPLWLRVMGAMRTPHFNFRIAPPAVTALAPEQQPIRTVPR